MAPAKRQWCAAAKSFIPELKVWSSTENSWVNVNDNTIRDNSIHQRRRTKGNTVDFYWLFYLKMPSMKFTSTFGFPVQGFNVRSFINNGTITRRQAPYPLFFSPALSGLSTFWLWQQASTNPSNTIQLVNFISSPDASGVRTKEMPVFHNWTYKYSLSLEYHSNSRPLTRIRGSAPIAFDFISLLSAAASERRSAHPVIIIQINGLLVVWVFFHRQKKLPDI